MPTRPTAILLTLAAFLAAADVSRAAEPGAFATISEKRGSFDDVLFDVRQSIIQHGFAVDATSHVGDMLERTAKDVGATKVVFSKAVGLQFCSVKLSRAMFEADPATIALCPSVVFVYELADKPGVIHVGYRKLPDGGTEAARAAIEDQRRMLDAIVKEALE